MKTRAACALFLLSLTASLGAKDLPKALLIGDSISIGYTPHVVAALKGKVQVIHHRGNAQHTQKPTKWKLAGSSRTQVTNQWSCKCYNFRVTLEDLLCIQCRVCSSSIIKT